MAATGLAVQVGHMWTLHLAVSEGQLAVELLVPQPRRGHRRRVLEARRRMVLDFSSIADCSMYNILAYLY